MTLQITIDMDNAAFGDYPRTELSRILRHLASVVEAQGPDSRPIFDANGNRVGRVVFDE